MFILSFLFRITGGLTPYIIGTQLINTLYINTFGKRAHVEYSVFINWTTKQNKILLITSVIQGVY